MSMSSIYGGHVAVVHILLYSLLVTYAVASLANAHDFKFKAELERDIALEGNEEEKLNSAFDLHPIVKRAFTHLLLKKRDALADTLEAELNKSDADAEEYLIQPRKLGENRRIRFRESVTDKS